MATHQAAKFCINLKLSRERVIHRIERYLKVAKDKGVIFIPDKDIVMECYVDAYFSGGWYKADSGNPEALLSKTGYVIIYASCPVI